MKCLIYFSMSSMKEGTSAQLGGRGELHGGARVTTLVTLRKCTLGNKREIKTLKFVSASTQSFKGGLSLDQALQERHGSDFFLLSIVETDLVDFEPALHIQGLLPDHWVHHVVVPSLT